MGSILTMLGTYIVTALVLISAENIVFARAVGFSRIISLADNVTSTVIFCSLLSITTTLSSIIYYYVYHLYIENSPYILIARVFATVLTISVSYMLVFIVAIKVMPYEHIGKAVEAMPTATFNCMVFSVVMASGLEQFTIVQTIIFSVASSIGYTLSILYVIEVQRKLQSRDIPAAFKGLPITLLYLAGLAMAIYGLTGRVFSL